jgi:(2Fe-2S) ferredoxin
MNDTAVYPKGIAEGTWYTRREIADALRVSVKLLSNRIKEANIVRKHSKLLSPNEVKVILELMQHK